MFPCSKVSSKPSAFLPSINVSAIASRQSSTCSINAEEISLQFSASPECRGSLHKIVTALLASALMGLCRPQSHSRTQPPCDQKRIYHVVEKDAAYECRIGMIITFFWLAILQPLNLFIHWYSWTLNLGLFLHDVSVAVSHWDTYRTLC